MGVTGPRALYLRAEHSTAALRLQLLVIFFLSTPLSPSRFQEADRIEVPLA